MTTPSTREFVGPSKMHAMISIETMTLPPADNGVTIAMVIFKDEHDRRLGQVTFNQFTDRPMALVAFQPGDDVIEARPVEQFGSEGAFATFLTPDESKRLPMRSDVPADLPENVRRLFPTEDAD